MVSHLFATYAGQRCPCTNDALPTSVPCLVKVPDNKLDILTRLSLPLQVLDNRSEAQSNIIHAKARWELQCIEGASHNLTVNAKQLSQRMLAAGKVSFLEWWDMLCTLLAIEMCTAHSGKPPHTSLMSVRWITFSALF